MRRKVSSLSLPHLSMGGEIEGEKSRINVIKVDNELMFVELILPLVVFNDFNEVKPRCLPKKLYNKDLKERLS